MKQYECKSLMLALTGVLLAFLCFLPVGLASPVTNPVKLDPIILSFNGYKITAYDVQVKVQENNTLDVTERITAQFDEPKHGIYRNIPLVNKVRRFINQETITHTQKAKISNVSVTDGSTGQALPLDKETKSGRLALKIGDAGKTITGEKTYVIHYSYALGDDGMRQFDELYYNLIGDAWDTYIGNVSFRIEMPKAFDPNNLVFLLGGAEAGSRVSYKVEGNIISGKVGEVVARGQGLTIRLELPEGYFNAGAEDNGTVGSALTIVFMLASVLLFLLFGRNPRLHPENGNNFPPDITPAEAGYVLGGDAQKRGRIALLLHWAEKGYLCLENDELGRTLLLKQREADAGMKPYEQTLFNAIFRNGDRIAPEKLRDQCIGVMTKVETQLKAYFNEPFRQMYTVASGIARKVSCLFTLVCVGLVAARIFGDAYSWIDGLSIAAATLAFAVMVFPFVLLLDYYARKNGTGSAVGTLMNLLGLLLILGALLGMLTYSDALDRESSLAVLAIGICGIAGAFTRRRSEFGNRLLGQILGLKHQVENGSKNREQMSGSFYSLLPYAYMFGMSEKWAKAFDSLELQPPQWFRGRFLNFYSTLYFSNWANEQLNSFESNITYHDSSSDGGGGGGSGGSGGGGGGSW